MKAALRGELRCEVSGAEPERFLNALADAGTAYWNAERADAFTLRLSIYSRDIGVAEALARRSQCELRRLRLRGAPALAALARRRYVLLAAGALCFALVAASSLFVWEIEVEGAESVPEGEILRALAGAGAAPGAFWPGWDAGAIANSVLLDVPELAWAGLSVSGSRAVLRVRERIPEPVIIDGSGRVTASTTGIIERMEVFSGRALVSEGDAVCAGETLVEGGTARITARTFREYTVSAPLEYVSLAEKRIKTRWALVLGERRINFFAGSSQTPAGCGKIVKEYPLALEGVFTLPVSILRERIWEYEPSAAAEDAAALAERLAETLRERLASELDGGGELLSEHVSSAESGGRLYVTLRAECREDIAVYTPGTGS